MGESPGVGRGACEGSASLRSPLRRVSTVGGRVASAGGAEPTDSGGERVADCQVLFATTHRVHQKG